MPVKMISAPEDILEYCEHYPKCILSQWRGGRPTADGGYEDNFSGTWYRSKPIDQTPKCDCGLAELLDLVKKETT